MKAATWALLWMSASLVSAAVFEAAPRAVVEGRDPALAVRASGAMSLLAVEKGDLWYLTSYDNGDTFEERVRVNDVPGSVASHSEASPRLCLRSRSELYTMWQSRPDGADRSTLLVARSVDWGQSFVKPVRVDPSSGASQGFATMNVSPGGNVYVAWLDGRDRGAGRTGASSVYIARSTDKGVSFEPAVRVAMGVCPCCRPSIGFGGDGVVYVSWRGVAKDNVRDIRIASSVDGGKTWSEPSRPAGDNWKINGCPHSGASLAAIGKRLFVSWYTVGEGRSGVYYAWSDDDGRTFSARHSLSENVLDSNHPSLLAAGGTILAVFQGRDAEENNGWGKIGVWYREINSDGTASPLVRLDSGKVSASYPTLSFEAPGRVFVAWTEPSGESGHHIVLVRGRRNQ